MAKPGSAPAIRDRLPLGSRRAIPGRLRSSRETEDKDGSGHGHSGLPERSVFVPRKNGNGPCFLGEPVGSGSAGPLGRVLSCLPVRQKTDGYARRRLSRALRVAACLLLSAIGADIVADTRCDKGSSSSASTAGVRGPLQGQRPTDEPCGSFCVPDCFCCSFSVAATPAVLPPEPGPLAPLDANPLERWSEGVRPVVDHPPLARA
jgi:hypothetical protein